MALVVRLLGPDDRAPLEAFLERHADSSLFLRSNLRAGGLVDEGEPFQATWVGGVRRRSSSPSRRTAGTAT